MRFLRNHLKRVCGTFTYTNSASHTVKGRYSHNEGVALVCNKFFLNGKLSVLGCISLFFLRQSEGTDCSMGAYKCTLVTTDTGFVIPLGNHNGNAAFLVSGSTLLKCTVSMVNKCGNRESVTVHKTNGFHNIVNHLDKFGVSLFCAGSLFVNCISPIGWNVNLNISGSTGINSLLVHLNDFDTLLHKLLGFLLHIADSLFGRKNLRK